MTVGDFIAVRPFPGVVQCGDVRELRTGHNPQATRDFISGYLGFDERSRYALGTCLDSLAGKQHGNAFFLNGVFGSGKSHLLGLLALLCDGIGHEAFAATHPHLTPPPCDAKRLVVYFSLDDYNAARISLEEAALREIAREWQRCFGEPLSWDATGSRREYFAALDEQLQARGYRGIVLLIDELSLFLSAREHSGLQGDAAFLQFVAQRAARSSSCTTHIFAAIQKTIEGIGEIEAYSLAQIRDRFQILPLSLAHIPSLISHRLIVHKAPVELKAFCRDSSAQLSEALPRLDFPGQEWETLFPFHPATISLLENMVTRFFSRTRSAALFCTQAVKARLNAPAKQRILPDSLFDYFLPELETHPELRALAGVWQRWQSEIQELAHNETEKQILQRLLKTLLVFKIAGITPTVVQLANAIALDAGLPGDGNYEYARVLLERVLSQGSHLAVERQESEQEFADRYTVDWSTRVSELARRYIRNTVQELHPDDSRITAYAQDCCRDELFPLRSLTKEQSLALFWNNAPFHIAVQALQAEPVAANLANRLAMLAEPWSVEDLLLLIVPPFSRLENNFTSAIQNPQLILWSPRLPTSDEWQVAREATASQLLEQNPQLLDNRRGRAVLQYLKEAAPTRELQLARLTRRLLYEGVLRSGDGRVIEAGELAAGQSWQSTLEAITAFALPAVFPQFEKVAPRLRVLTENNSDLLALQLLRTSQQDPYFSASAERLVRALAQPLGIAAADKGRWKMTALRADLAQEIKTVLGQGNTPRALALHFAKSGWGLKTEQLTLALSALLRSGEVSAQDFKGQLITAARIGLPLDRSVHLLRPGQLLESDDWNRLKEIVRLLTGHRLGAASFPEQTRANELMTQWMHEARSSCELLQARLRQLQRTLGHSSTQWPQAEGVMQEMATLLENLSEGLAANTLQQSLPDISPSALSPLLVQWKKLALLLENRLTELLTLHRLLTHANLSTPPELQELRCQLLQQMESGEALLEDDGFFIRAAGWHREYATLYQRWHSTQHESARWNSLRRLQNGDELRALERLSALQSRSFPLYSETQEALETEFAKQCPRDGSLLPGEATCNACDLRFGQRLAVRSAGEIEAAVANTIITFQSNLHEPQTSVYLTGTALPTWNGDAGELLPLLDDATLAALDEAFKPRRRAVRDLAGLKTHFAHCRTRSEFENAFSTWLRGPENLEADDEIELA